MNLEFVNKVQTMDKGPERIKGKSSPEPVYTFKKNLFSPASCGISPVICPADKK